MKKLAKKSAYPKSKPNPKRTPREDANQAAARIIREATQDH